MHGNDCYTSYHELWASASRRLQQMIIEHGRIHVGDDGIPIHGFLDVSDGVNHRVDIPTIDSCVDAFSNAYSCCYPGRSVDVVLTVETSGIAFATLLARRLNCDAIYAKKKKKGDESINGRDVYATRVKSFTHGDDYTMVVAKEALRPNKRVLIADDFFATSNASMALLEIVRKAYAQLAGLVGLITKDIPEQDGWKKLTLYVGQYNQMALLERRELIFVNTFVRITGWPYGATNTDELAYAEPCLRIP